MTGESPAPMIDHINGKRDDNRWCNLRATNAFLNQQNRTRPERGNKTGLLGVTPHRGKYSATIRAGNAEKFLGVYETAEAAHAAYLAAKAEMHPHSWLAKQAAQSPQFPHGRRLCRGVLFLSEGQDFYPLCADIPRCPPLEPA